MTVDDEEPQPSEPTEFDRRAAAWLRKRIPGANPDLGSVQFSTDCAAYDSGGWAKIDVSWTETDTSWTPPWTGARQFSTLIDDAWQADLTGIIRELLETDRDEGEG